MGKKFAPAYANIYMAHWEERALARCPLRPLYYYRYLDDIWGIWPGSKSQFVHFVAVLNDCDPSIQLTYQLSTHTIDFLDTTTYKGPDFLTNLRLEVKVFFKTTDTHALLHKTSFHPRHTYKGLVKSQILRFNRICSRDGDFRQAVTILFKALRDRGYSRSFLRLCLRTFSDRPEKVLERPIPLINTFNSMTVTLNSSLKANFTRFLGEREPFDKYRVISAFRRSQNLRDILVRATLSSPEIRVKTPTMDTYFMRLRFISNKVTHTWHEVTQTSSPTTSNCVYLIFCSLCPSQFVGGTKVQVSAHLKRLRLDVHPEGDLDSPVVHHFLTHGLGAFRYTVLQSNTTWTPAQRNVRVQAWLHLLGADSIFPW